METKNTWVIIIIVIVLLAVVILIIPGKKVTTGKLSADGVDIIPAMTYRECMDEIQATNPKMSDSDAKDNCIAIDAVTKGNADTCDDITNPTIKQLCFDQF